jgi:cation diffusion facilitator family transporter
MQEGSRRAIIAAFLANLGIVIAKLVAFAFTGAASMLAEAIHSFADTGNQGLLFLGGARAGRAPDEAHQFGHGRERYFWAFVVALVLFSLGSLFAIYEGISKLLEPHQLESPEWALGVLGIAVVLETLSLRTAAAQADRMRGRRGWWRFIRTTKNAELPVVLLEDTGALIGLVFAISGVSLTAATGEPAFDAIGSIAIGVLLAMIAFVLAREMKSLLIGESASPEEQEMIRRAIEAGPEVDRLIHLRTEHLGPEDLLVAAKVDLSSTADQHPARAIDRVEERIRDRVPSARVIYIEPDVFREKPREAY